MQDDAVVRAVRFRISERDYIRAMQLHARPTRLGWLVLGVLTLGLAVAAAFGEAIWRVAALSGLVGGTIVMAVSYTLLPWMARRHYRKYPAMQGEFSVALQEDGLRFTSAHAAGVLVWDNMLKWRRNDAYVLVYVMPRLFHILPVSLASQGFALDTFTAQLAQRLGRAT